MIRFVDIRGQGTGYRFCFWDTCYATFCTFGGQQAWKDRSDFEEAFRVSGGIYVDPVRLSDVSRFTSLIPDWALQPMSDEEPL